MLVNIVPRETVQPFVEYVRGRIREFRSDSVPEEMERETLERETTYDPLGDMGEQVSRLRDLWERGHITDAEMGAYLRQIESQR